MCVREQANTDLIYILNSKCDLYCCRIVTILFTNSTCSHSACEFEWYDPQFMCIVHTMLCCATLAVCFRSNLALFIRSLCVYILEKGRPSDHYYQFLKNYFLMRRISSESGRGERNERMALALSVPFALAFIVTALWGGREKEEKKYLHKAVIYLQILHSSRSIKTNRVTKYISILYIYIVHNIRHNV